MSTTRDRGQIEPVSYRYKWEIDDSCFECCKEVEDSVESPIFTTKTSSKSLKWRLKLFPKGRKGDFEYTPLFIISYNDAPTEIHYSLSLYSKSKKRIVLYFEKIVQCMFKEQSTGYGVRHIYKEDFLVDEKSGRLFDNDCIILCDITIDNDIAKADIIYKTDPRLDELEYLEELLLDEEFCDVTIKLKDQVFHAHKSILSTRSPVFKAMFKHDMKEKINNTVEIQDIEPEVFEEMLQFIYTATVNNIKETDIHSLFIAADKYSIEGLKSLCENAIINTITLNNAVKILKFADDYNVMELKKQIIDFIALNSEKMMDIPEYQSIEELPSRLVFELFKAVSSKKIKSS